MESLARGLLACTGEAPGLGAHGRAVAPRTLPLPAAMLLACSTPVADVGGVEGSTGPASSSGGSTSIGGETTTDSSGSSDPSGPADSSSGPGPVDSSDGSNDDAPLLDVGSAETGGVVDDCAEGNDLVVVLFEDSSNPYANAPELHRFDPTTGTFALLGALECAWDEDLAQYRRLSGIVVDRQARALIFDSQVNAFLSVDLADLSQCASLPNLYVNDSLPNPISQAYAVIDPDDPESERMFVGNDIGQNLGGGALPGSFGWAEVDEAGVTTHLLGGTPFIMTLVVGTGDGRVFAIGGYGDNPPPVDIVELDPEDGTVLDTFLQWPTLPYPAFYGGDLLMIDRGTQVVYPDFVSSAWRYDLDDDDGNGEHDIIEVAADDAFPYAKHPVGVSSPTCIPTAPAG